MAFWNRTKSFESATTRSTHSALKPTLSWVHLVGLGVGGIVGTGIYTLTGVGAGMAGPAVILSFVVAGMVCACAALAYAEMATMMPMAGSAYTYTYVALGELLAWIVGWTLILEYTVVCSAVAVGWSGYAAGVIRSAGWPIPEALLAGPYAGGLVNLPAILISLAVAGLLAIGSRESATVNFVLVGVKLVALAIFIALALPAFNADNFQPFAPFGYGSVEIADGTKHGMMAAAAIIFFAFYGFDAVSTAAEETKNPKRDLKIGIIGSMVLCTLLYMIVAAAALGGSNYQALAKSGEPLAMVLRNLQPSARRDVDRFGGRDRAADGHHGVHVRPVAHLLRDGARRAAAAAAERGASALRHAGADDVHHQRHRCADRGVRAAAEHRRGRQRRNADRVHRGRGVHDRDAPTHPQHPRMFGPATTWIIGIARDHRLHLPVLQPADAGRCTPC